jgi:hypothetical protein
MAMDGNSNKHPHRQPESEQTSVDRLLRAADLLMAARGRGDDSEAFVDAWLGKADDGAPGIDRPFTYEELVEGMCFLIRCGFVDPTVPARPRGGRVRHGSH